MQTVILIINFNNHQDLKACIQSCLELNCSDFHLLIVENGSKPETVEQNRIWLQSLGLTSDNTNLNLRSNKISYHYSADNLGFGKGNNLGFELIKSMEVQPSFVWLLNNDAVCDNNALTALIDCMKGNSHCGFAGSLIFDFSKRNRIQGAGGIVLPWLGITRHLLKGVNALGIEKFPKYADYQSGASLLVRFNLILKYGGFHPAYFLYFEETDWQIRMKKNGWQNHLEPKSMVYHKESESSRNAPGHFYFNYFKSAIIFLKLNYTIIHLVSAIPFLIVLLIWRSRFSLPLFKCGMKGIFEGVGNKYS